MLLTFIFLGGLCISLFSNKFLLRFSQNLGIRNKNDIIVRWSSTSKPSLGGIGLYFSLVGMVMVYASLFPESNPFGNDKFVGLLIAATLAFVMGLLDDAYNTFPLFKLMCQILCGVILVFTGTVIDLFHNPMLDGLITIVFIVGVMNSLNMLDNMDGITGTVTVFILLSCILVPVFFGNEMNILCLVSMLAVLGGLIGFLVFNITPSKMFMGDTGSQFVGLFVGYFGIDSLWNFTSGTVHPSWLSFLLVLTAFTPTAIDTLTVIINRSKAGKSVMIGGKDHTTHHLVYKGHSDFKVWVIFTFIGLFSTVFTLIEVSLIQQKAYYLCFVGLLFFLAVFLPLYMNTIKYKAPIKE